MYIIHTYTQKLDLNTEKKINTHGASCMYIYIITYYIVCTKTEEQKAVKIKCTKKKRKRESEKNQWLHENFRQKI